MSDFTTLPVYVRIEDNEPIHVADVVAHNAHKFAKEIAGGYFFLEGVSQADCYKEALIQLVDGDNTRPFLEIVYTLKEAA